ncbi:MAG: acetyltransferase [Bacteroidia bacterium]|nr:MAG: acetyltransferase [Bacteroidia bacterium]
MILSFFFNGLAFFLSIIPQSWFYLFSRFLAFLLSHGIKYRRKVIEQNLKNAFPCFSEERLQKIKNQFYVNLTDQFLEMLLMAVGNYERIKKNYQIDVTELNQLYDEGKSVLMVLGHQFNWEWGLWTLSKETKFHVQGVYMPIKNPSIDRWLVNIRGKYGAEMVPANQVRTLLKPPTHKPTLTLIIGDQSPANLEHCLWTTFLNQETAFINTYEKIAQKRKMAVVFIEVIKNHQGSYRTPYKIFCKDASKLKTNEIVQNFVYFLEESIQKNPDNWLWSHRRWKHKKMNSVYIC